MAPVKSKEERRLAALKRLQELGEPPCGIMATLTAPDNTLHRSYSPERGCQPYSTACGADAWLQFDETDDPLLKALNGKCVVTVSRCEGKVMTDEEDPRNPGHRLWVWPKNLCTG